MYKSTLTASTGGLPPGVGTVHASRCSQAVLDFLANTDVGRAPGPPVAGGEDEAASEASEWEAREQAEL